MADFAVREVEGGVVFGAKIVPGSSKTAICGLHDRRLKIKVAAAPEKGKANKQLLDFLARQLGVKKKAISIIGGRTSPAKQIEVQGISPQKLLERLKLDKTERG
jgi:uncharacterized protein (TIGR00251 family)